MKRPLYPWRVPYFTVDASISPKVLDSGQLVFDQRRGRRPKEPSGVVDTRQTHLFEMEVPAGSPHTGALSWCAGHSNDGLPSLDTQAR